MNDFELRLRRDLNTATDQTDVAAALLATADKFSDEFHNLEQAKHRLDTLARNTLEKAHPRAISPINELMKGVNTHWEQVEDLLDERVAAARDLHAQLREHDKEMKELDGFRVEKQVSF